MLGTCQWLPKHQAYLDWIELPHSSLLWLKGGPGTGKTILLSTLIQSLQRELRPTIYFYFVFRDPEYSNVQACLRSLIAQMQSLRRCGFEDAHGGNYEEPKESITQLFETFSKAACEIDGLICCIDAVDECDEVGSRELMCSIDRLVCSKSSSIKFILTCRTRYYSLYASKAENSIIEVPNPESKKDLEEYIDAAINASQKVDLGIKPKVTEKLKISAEGMFLWAKLALEELENGPADDAHIRELCVPGIDRLYRRTLDSSISTTTRRESTLLCTILNWIVTTTRPLKVDELAIALAVRPGDSWLERGNLLWDPEKSFFEIASSLILVSDDIIRPAHGSLTNFLHTDMAPSITADYGLTVPIVKGKANAHLALICITYLSFQDFTHAYGSQKQNSMFMFLEYAATSWYQHAVQAGNDVRLYKAIVKFLQSPQGFRWMDGLLIYFGRSFESLLDIQSQLSQWTDSIRPSSSAPTLLSDCYLRIVADIDRHASKTREERDILERASIVQLVLGVHQAEKHKAAPWRREHASK